MTHTTGDTNTIAALRARNTLITAVRAQLKGAGLDIRELASELVISHPGHPEHGRIYITYTRREVSHRRTSWDYLGGLDGHTSSATEPRVTTATIITTLTGQPVPPGPSACGLGWGDADLGG